MYECAGDGKGWEACFLKSRELLCVCVGGVEGLKAGHGFLKVRHDADVSGRKGEKCVLAGMWTQQQVWGLVCSRGEKPGLRLGQGGACWAKLPSLSTDWCLLLFSACLCPECD